jgi:hypothetical protein
LDKINSPPIKFTFNQRKPNNMDLYDITSKLKNL